MKKPKVSKQVKKKYIQIAKDLNYPNIETITKEINEATTEARINDILTTHRKRLPL